MPPLITFRNVTLGYGRTSVLKDLTFSVAAGDFFGIVGPNGAGKTTLLRAILGILRPQSGEVIVHAGEGKGLRLGYVPQRDTVDNLMPYTSAEVVMMGRYRGMRRFRRPGPVDREKVRESMQHVGVETLHGRVFKDLSGGQKQRVLIARALASGPDVLILDEPTNGMDLTSRRSILDVIRTVHERDALTILMVSHLLDDVATYVKTIALVERDFFQVGKAEEVLTEKNLSALYGMAVRVHFLPHGVVIVPGGGDGNR